MEHKCFFNSCRDWSKRVIIIIILILLSVTVCVIAHSFVNSQNKSQLVQSGLSLKDIVQEKNIIYSTEDTDTGKTAVYYKSGVWATYKDDDLFLLQEYLLPKNKQGTLFDEVKDLPEFSEDTVSYKLYNTANGNIYDTVGTATYSDLANTYAATEGTLNVYVEWTSETWAYSYVMRYADVSVLYTYKDTMNLFRNYTKALLQGAETSQSSTITTSAETTSAETTSAETTPTETTSAETTPTETTSAETTSAETTSAETTSAETTSAEAT